MCRVMIITTVMILTLAGTVHAQSNGSTRNQREQYRDAMQDQTDTDYVDSVRLREERRDMLRKGVTPGQVRAQQEAEIDMRRSAHPADFSDDAVVKPTFTDNSPYVGFSTPRKKEEKPSAGTGK